MLIRRPACAVLGIPCSHVRWQVPPITSRSPPPGSKARDRPPPAGRRRKRRRAERHDGHDRVAPRPPQAIAVEGHAVAAVAVRGQRHPRQRSAVVGRERVAHEGDQRMPGAVLRPRRDQPRDVHHPLVHHPAVRLPRGRGPERVQHRLVALDPLRQVVDPRSRAQVGPREAGQRGVAARRLGEEARLVECGRSRLVHPFMIPRRGRSCRPLPCASLHRSLYWVGPG